LKERGLLPSFVRVVETVKCEGPAHLKDYAKGITAKGGEGVMLRDPQSLYIAGRSKNLCKYKDFLDTEVKVIANNYPHGFNCVQ
jgi:DNA ligase-1